MPKETELPERIVEIDPSVGLDKCVATIYDPVSNTYHQIFDIPVARSTVIDISRHN